MQEPKVNLTLVVQLEQTYHCLIWICRDGSYAPIVTMEVHHLYNCYQMIVRKIQYSIWAYSTIYTLPEDGMAFYYAEEEANEFYCEHLPRLKDILSKLEGELDRRGFQYQKAEV